jgi:hypothetical protein
MAIRREQLLPDYFLKVHKSASWSTDFNLHSRTLTEEKPKGMQKPNKLPTPLQEKLNTTLTIIVLALFISLPPILCGLLYLSQVPDVTWGEDDPLN